MFDLDDNDPDDGASAHYLPAPTLVLPASPSGALWNTCVGGSNPGTSCQTSAQCTGGGTCATASDLGVRFSKLQAHGASASVRVTYATANLLYPAADPPMPAIFPDQKQCRSGSNNLAHCTVDSECPGGTCAGDGRKVLCFTGDSTYHNKDLAEHLAAYTLEATDIYRESRGASSLGDIETGFPQLLLGQTGGGMPVDLRLGELGHPCDIIFVGEGLNALHAPTGTAGMADPAGPTTKVCASGANDGFLCTAASECPGGTCEAWGGIGQAGFCEDWNEDTGYGARQGAPCMCAESATWDTAVTANVTLSSLCLIKNVHFGTGAWEETCSCTPASSECSVGGTLPFGTNATTTTCNGAGRCVSTTSDFRASADAGARDWVTPGCAPGTAIGCPGVCITQTPVARLLLSAERIQAIADAAPSHPLVVWNTIPYSSRWWRNRPEVDAWNAGLLAWAIAGGHAFVDLAGIFATHCDDLYRSHGAGESSCLTNDGIHWKAVAQDLAGSTWVTCASNGNDTAFCRGGTNSGGICTASSECPNGTCAKSHDGHCASGVCDAGKVGDVCTRDEQCSYWWCPLP